MKIKNFAESELEFIKYEMPVFCFWEELQKKRKKLIDGEKFKKQIEDAGNNVRRY